MTNLERLKSTEIDPRRLLKLKLEKDKKMQISIKKKVCLLWFAYYLARSSDNDNIILWDSAR